MFDIWWVYDVLILKFGKPESCHSVLSRSRIKLVALGDFEALETASWRKSVFTGTVSFLANFHVYSVLYRYVVGILLRWRQLNYDGVLCRSSHRGTLDVILS